MGQWPVFLENCLPVSKNKRNVLLSTKITLGVTSKIYTSPVELGQWPVFLENCLPVSKNKTLPPAIIPYMLLHWAGINR